MSVLDIVGLVGMTIISVVIIGIVVFVALWSPGLPWEARAFLVVVVVTAMALAAEPALTLWGAACDSWAGRGR